MAKATFCLHWYLFIVNRKRPAKIGCKTARYIRTIAVKKNHLCSPTRSSEIPSELFFYVLFQGIAYFCAFVFPVT